MPLYYDLRDLGLIDTYWALILPQVGTSVAFGTFWMRAFFRSVPRSLRGGRADSTAPRAGRRSGASCCRSARPAVLTMTVLLFMWTWNEFLLALVMVTDEGLRRRRSGSRSSRAATRPTTLLAAGAVIVAMPDRAALRDPPAPLHPRHARRGGEGLMAARLVPRRRQAFGDGRGGARALARDRGRRVHGARRAFGLGQDDRAADAGRARGRDARARSRSATAWSTRVAPRERDIAMVFQDYALYPQMTVCDNLAFGLRRRKVTRDEIDRRVRGRPSCSTSGELLDRQPARALGRPAAARRAGAGAGARAAGVPDGRAAVEPRRQAARADARRDQAAAAARSGRRPCT